MRTCSPEEFESDRAAFFQVVFANEYRELLSQLHLGSIAIDCGANVGFFSLLASRLVGRNGRVIAIEPDPSNASHMLRQLEANGVANVTLLQRAIFAQNDVSVGLGGQGIFAHVDENGPVRVRSITLDAIVDSVRPKSIDVVKVDIEGAERYLVNESESPRWLSAVDSIAMEVHTDESYTLVTRTLKEAGFVVSGPFREWHYVPRVAANLKRHPLLPVMLYGRSLLPLAWRLFSGAVRHRQYPAGRVGLEPVMIYGQRRPKEQSSGTARGNSISPDFRAEDGPRAVGKAG